MKSTRSTPSYKGLTPSSARASAAARGSSRKSNTSCELLLKTALSSLGVQCRASTSDVLGKPDFVFRAAKVVVFCDGDFWHGRELASRINKLERGHNAPYWVAKIQTNVKRDQRVTAALEGAGWCVFRFWESEIRADPTAVALRIHEAVRSRSARQ